MRYHLVRTISYFIKCDTLNHHMNENKYSRTANSERNRIVREFFENEMKILTRQYNELDKDWFRHNVVENYLLHWQNLQKNLSYRFLFDSPWLTQKWIGIQW